MLVQCWPTVCVAGPASNQHAGLVVLTAGGELKPIPTQCLLNVGPAAPVLGSIHSALSVLHEFDQVEIFQVMISLTETTHFVL